MDLEGWGDCRLASLSSGDADFHDSLAVAYDGTLNEAFLQTRGDFGCVQFEVGNSAR